jgi:hypothetical protein
MTDLPRKRLGDAVIEGVQARYHGQPHSTSTRSPSSSRRAVNEGASRGAAGRSGSSCRRRVRRARCLAASNPLLDQASAHGEDPSRPGGARFPVTGVLRSAILERPIVKVAREAQAVLHCCRSLRLRAERHAYPLRRW